MHDLPKNHFRVSGASWVNINNYYCYYFITLITTRLPSASDSQRLGNQGYNYCKIIDWTLSFLLTHYISWDYCNVSQPEERFAIAGLEINEKFQSQLYDRIPKFSRNLATFSSRIFARLFALHFPVSGSVTFLFRKSRGKISRKFATSPDILVAKGKN